MSWDLSKVNSPPLNLMCACKSPNGPFVEEYEGLISKGKNREPGDAWVTKT